MLAPFAFNETLYGGIQTCKHPNTHSPHVCDTVHTHTPHTTAHLLLTQSSCPTTFPLSSSGSNLPSSANVHNNHGLTVCTSPTALTQQYRTHKHCEGHCNRVRGMARTAIRNGILGGSGWPGRGGGCIRSYVVNKEPNTNPMPAPARKHRPLYVTT